MPFAGYKNFAACVAANADKGDPEAYCATIQRAVEKVNPDHPLVKHYPGGEDHDQKLHGRRGNASVATVPALGGRLEIATDADLDAVPEPTHRDPFAGARQDPATGALILNNGIRVTVGGIQMPDGSRWARPGEMLEIGGPERAPDEFHRQIIQELEDTAPGLLDAAALKDIQKPDMTIRFVDEQFPDPFDPMTMGLHDPDTNELWLTTVRRISPSNQWTEPRTSEDVVSTMIHEIAHKVDDRYGTGNLESVEAMLGVEQFDFLSLGDIRQAAPSPYDAFDGMAQILGSKEAVEAFAYPLIMTPTEKFSGELFAEAVRYYYTDRSKVWLIDEVLGTDLEGYVEETLARAGADRPVTQPPLFKADAHSPEEFFALIDWYQLVTGLQLPGEGMSPDEAYRIADALWEETEAGGEDGDFELEKHQGPGDHPSGSPQSVHGRRGPGTTQAPTGTAYDPPIEHTHSTGPLTPELEDTLAAGKPIREEFKRRLAGVEVWREELLEEYGQMNNEWSVLVNQEIPIARRMSYTAKMIAKIEAGRYRGASQELSIVAYLMEPEHGATVTERLTAWRATRSEDKPIEVQLTKAQDAELGDIEATGYDDLHEIEGQYEIETLLTRNGKPKGGVLRIYTEEAQAVWGDRLLWGARTYSYWPADMPKSRMLHTVRTKVLSAPPPSHGTPPPDETWWKVWPREGYHGLWDEPIKSMGGNTYDKMQGNFLAGTVNTQFLGDTGWEPVAGHFLLGNYEDGFTYDRIGDRTSPDRHYESTGGRRVVSSTAFVDRLLVDADWAAAEMDKLAPQIKKLEQAKKANTAKRMNMRRNMVGEILTKNNIPIGTEVAVPAKRGVAKKLAEDTAYMPAVWVEEFNDYITDNSRVEVSVQKKNGGGYYREVTNFMAGTKDIQIRVDGSTPTNIHEVGHGLEEHVTGMKGAIKEFFNYRTNSAGIRSRKVSSGRIYSDSFTDEYTGKRYDWGDHEILSNGLGNLYGGHRGTPDDEHLDWLFGMMVKFASRP